MQFNEYVAEKQTEMAKLFLNRKIDEVRKYYAEQIEAEADKIRDKILSENKRKFIRVSGGLMTFPLIQVKDADMIRNKYKNEFNEAVEPIEKKRDAVIRQLKDKYNAWKMTMLKALMNGKAIGIEPAYYNIKYK